MTREGWVVRLVERDKKNPQHDETVSAPETAAPSHLEEFFQSLQPEMRRPKPSSEAVVIAMDAAQRLAAEAGAEHVAENTVNVGDSSGSVCRICGHRNRVGNRFCGMCGGAMSRASTGAEFAPEEEPLSPAPFLPPELGARTTAGRPAVQETHHYHHHYHHHFLPGAEAASPRGTDALREDRMRPNAALRGDMSRAEAAVRRITHEWVLACNTKHLDDLLDLYVADPLVLRSNYPPVRGAAAVREFFFGALDAGLGEVELEPLRIDVAGDLAYEAGRCKALVPGATGKRREERGKYLWVFARQSNGEWKLAADCWSSDLTLTILESDVPAGAGVKAREPRKA